MLVCGDLSLPQQICQAVHAAYESGLHLGDKKNGISSVVICSVTDEKELVKADYRLKESGIKTALFHEPDLGGRATALATEQVTQAARKVLSRYPLWKGA